DRLDAELLKRAFLGWLRGERNHCKVVAIPTLKDEDAKRPSRERESLVGEQKADCQPNEGSADSAGHPRIQSQTEKGRRGALTVCKHGGGSRSRRTRWLSCGATWSADGLSAIKFGRSRRYA